MSFFKAAYGLYSSTSVVALSATSIGATQRFTFYRQTPGVQLAATQRFSFYRQTPGVQLAATQRFTFYRELPEVQLVSSATNYVATNTTHTVTLPTRSTGDLMICVLATEDGHVDTRSHSSGNSVTSSTDWIAIEALNANQIRHGFNLYARVVDGTETATYDFTLSAAKNSGSMVMVIRGVDTDYWFENLGFIEALSGTTVVAPSVYSSYNDASVLRIFTGQGTSLTDDLGAGLSDVVQQSTTGEFILAGFEHKKTGGQVGTYSVTQGSTNDNYGVTLVLKPATAVTDHSSVLYRNDVGITTSDAQNVFSNETPAFTSQGTVYMRYVFDVSGTRGINYGMIQGLDSVTKSWEVETNGTSVGIGANGLTDNWTLGGAVPGTFGERMTHQVQLNNATASPVETFVRLEFEEPTSAANWPGNDQGVASTDTTTAGAATFDRVSFGNATTDGSTTYTRILIASESVI